MKFLIKWLIFTLAIIITAYLIPGAKVDSLFSALVAALVLGLINTILRPILIVLTLPINILTLGLFTLVINAFLVILTSIVVPGFAVAGFWWALAFSLVLSVVNFVLGQLAD